MSYDIASISETTTPIDKKFRDNIWTTKMCPAMQYCDVITNPRWRTAAILKIAKYHISWVKNRPILIKFGTLKQIFNPMTVTGPKIKICKIQDGGGSHLENRFLVITQPIVRFQRNFVWGSRTACRQGLHDKNCKFLKSKMADGRHYENRKIAISQ